MKTHIIRLEHHDDATSIRDKMSWSKAARILLAFPKRRIPALRALDLSLIQREAGRLGAQLALVTHDREISANAMDLGVPVFTNIPEAQRQYWSRPREKRHLAPHESQLPELLVRRTEFSHKGEPNRPQWLRMVGFFLGVSGVFLLVLFFIPSATITIVPQRLMQSLTLKFWANPKVSIPTANGGMPAQIQHLTVEGSLEGTANAFTTIAETAAVGKLTLTNLTESQVIVPIGTVFSSINNPKIRFASTQAVNILAGIGQSAEADIQSLAAGTGGNVPENTIQAVEGSIGLSISATNPQATTGGSDRRVRAAGEQDYNRLYDSLLTTLSESAISKMDAAAGDQLTLIPSSLKLEKILADEHFPAIGEPADIIRIDLRLEFAALAVQEKDIEEVARLALDADLPVGQNFKTNDISITVLSVPTTDADGIVRWTARASRTIVPQMDVEQIIQQLLGRPVQQAKEIIAAQVPLATQPEISQFPSFWNRLPYLPFRLHVVEK